LRVAIRDPRVPDVVGFDIEFTPDGKAVQGYYVSVHPDQNAPPEYGSRFENDGQELRTLLKTLEQVFNDFLKWSTPWSPPSD
jgi:hypothetical protein